MSASSCSSRSSCSSSISVVGLRQRLVGGLPLLGDRVPLVERQLGRPACLVDDRAHDLHRLLGRLAGVGVEEDLRALAADGDALAERRARLVLELVLVELLREVVALLELDGDAPVLGHQYTGGGPPTSSGISGFQAATVGSRESASSTSFSQAATNASTADSAVS